MLILPDDVKIFCRLLHVEMATEKSVEPESISGGKNDKNTCGELLHKIWKL